MEASNADPSMAAISALQSFLDTHPPPSDSPHALELHDLALQAAHNLRYQHLWTDVRLHSHSAEGLRALPRPLVSGVPPRRAYVHPEEQIELLQKQRDEGKSGMPELEREREWVMPSHLREKWSLRKFGETFDAVAAAPGALDGEALFVESQSDEIGEAVSPWRQKLPKRILLATLDDDSTVVYYIVHDGIVKPRQN